MSERHDFETKLEVAIAYLMTGSSYEAARLCNVPGRTIRYWMQESWWEDILSEARTVKQKELDAIWTGLIHKAADSLRKRLDEGDVVLDKWGKERNLPVKAKDLALIMSMVTDKRALARGQATSRKETVSIDKKMEALQQGFKKIAEQDESDGPTQH